MKFLGWLLAGVLSLGTVMMGTSCVTLDDGNQGLESVEEMTEDEFIELKVYVQLGLSQALKAINADPADLQEAADLVRQVTTTPVDDDVTLFITSALQEAGFQNEELMLALLLVETELLGEVFLDYVNVDGTLKLSERSEELLLLLADELEDAALGV
jgi:hypothetical protein